MNMATYYVDGKSGNDSANGSSGAPWKTLGKAASQVKPGDEVRIRTATYYEQLNIGVTNTAWRADTGHTPVIDGRWHEGLMSNGKMPAPGPNHLPAGGEHANILLIKASGVLVDGLTVQNSGAGGIGISNGADVVVRNCRTDFTYGTAIKVAAGPGWADRVVIENNIMTRAVRSRLVSGPTNWPGALNVSRARDGIIRNNVLAYSFGESINIHRGSVRVIVEGNIIHDSFGVCLYIQRSSGVILRNNLIYCTGTPEYLHNGFSTDGILQGDEIQSEAFPESIDNQIYNNIVVNTGRLFTIRSNPTNYKNSRLRQTYIGYNTFIGGPNTKVGINIVPAQSGFPHEKNIFENNIIANIPASGSISNGSGEGILFRNNLWDQQPITSMRGSGDRIGNPNLVNPTAKLRNVYPEPQADIDPRNYQLTSTSNLAIGMASNGSAANGLTPPTIQKDFFGAARDNKPDIGAHEYAGISIDLTANFSIGPGQAVGQLPHTVDFIDKSIASSVIVSRRWEFGDGETSTEVNPSHTYTRAGDFDVSLTVTDNAGNSNTSKRDGLISVTEASSVTLPEAFRRFVLMQRDQQIVMAYGTQYPDLRCVLVWNKDPFHILNFDTVDDIDRHYTQDGTAAIIWLDSGDQDDSAAGLRLIDSEEEGLRQTGLSRMAATNQY